MSTREYCCEKNPGEPMTGTADPVDVWVMLEYRPAWKARAVEESALGEDTRRWLDAGLAALDQAGLRGRPQLVRQPELDTHEVRLLVGTAGRLVVFSGSGYDFLDGVDLLAVAREPDAYAQLDEPRYFVCTNGQRDLCCARHGLPAYAALRERVGDRAWQVTHLGGHRFAPNVLVLPQGALYGRVQPAEVDEFVAEVDAGRLAAPWLRGRTRYEPAVQAAEALTGRSDLTFVRRSGDDSAARVTFRAGEEELSVNVARTTEALEVLKSCGDAAPKAVYPFRAA